MQYSLSRQRGQTLIIIFFGMLFFGGSALIGGVFVTGKSVDDLRKEIRHVVADEARRQRADQVLKSWDDAADDYVDSRKDYGNDFLKLLARHDARPEEFDGLFASIDASNAEAITLLQKQRSALRQQLTKEEWHQLFSAAPVAPKTH